ncbi:N-acetylmuramoyl-L-alanine amidase family protein, partial [Xanthomonas vasicola]|uniref:N-acetylmuramoyl-L-alanine amidase family protein n=1 Tax=Xanthomonas vasicola TaxID=56459 RepID=UPI00155B1CD6
MPSIAQDKDARFQLASVDQQTKSAISRSLKVELQKYIDGQMGRLPDQDAHILVNGVSVTSKGALVVDLSRGFLPRVPGRIEEDRRDQLKSLYIEVIDPTLSADFRNTPVEFTVEGRSFEEWEPEDPTLKPKKKSKKTSIVEPKKVVISASHGLYYHYGLKSWEYQRPEISNGIIEDLLTPSHGYELASLIGVRSGDDIFEPRTRSNTINGTTKRPWWEMAARYTLERQYPGRTDIWGVTSQPTSNQREYLKDINSRTRYANEVGADALISLHTNASATNPNARGTWVLVLNGRPTDYALGQSILCGMKEQIHALPAYADYHVDDTPRESNLYGENAGFPDIKKVVIETGFHSNAADAAALQDPAFITAAST